MRVQLMPELNVAPPQLTSCSLRRWRKTTHRPADTPRHFVLGQGQRAHAARVGVVHGQGRKMLEKVVSRECKSRKSYNYTGYGLSWAFGDKRGATAANAGHTGCSLIYNSTTDRLA